MRALLVTDQVHTSPALERIADTLRTRGFRVDQRAAASDGSWDVVVHWAGGSTPGSAGIVLNPSRCVQLAASPMEAAMLLHTHGIPVHPDHLPRHAVRPASSPSYEEMKLMKVHVGDLRVLAVEGETKAPSFSEWRYQRIMEAACRSVYVLGLHFGCVHVRVHSTGRWHVQKVDPAPEIADDLATLYASSVAHLVTSRFSSTDPAEDVVVGADPEFALVTREGKLVYASRYVKHTGTVGHDRQSRLSRGGVFPLVEVRPSPSPSPLTVFANTERALISARSLLPHRRTLWVAGSYPHGKYPTGGHIHFSGLVLSTPVMYALDHYMALPCMLLEQRLRARRRRQKYGRLGEFRRKSHGGFEYRTLASWLVSPEATRAVLCLAKVVGTEWRQLESARLENGRIAKEFYLGKKGRFRHHFKALWRAVMSTETAQQYQYELAYFPHMIESGKEWDDDADIKDAWW